jgi:hypothetical protein
MLWQRNFGCGAVRRDEAANLRAGVPLSRTGDVLEVGNRDIGPGLRQREGDAPFYASCSSGDERSSAGISGSFFEPMAPCLGAFLQQGLSSRDLQWWIRLPRREFSPVRSR